MSAPSVLAWAVVCLATNSMAATDHSGKWSGTSPQMGKVYAVLQQDGAKLTGSAGPSESRQLPITTGRAEGDHLTFDVKIGGRNDALRSHRERGGAARRCSAGAG